HKIWDNRGRRWWGDLYELCPDDLVAELNGRARMLMLAPEVGRTDEWRRGTPGRGRARRWG
ncbi:hypothetical protein ABZ590_30800, partial [Streptomyces hirsutus]